MKPSPQLKEKLLKPKFVPKFIANLERNRVAVGKEISDHFEDDDELGLVANLTIEQIANAVSLPERDVRVAIGVLVAQGYLAVLVRVSGVHRFIGRIDPRESDEKNILDEFARIKQLGLFTVEDGAHWN